MKAGGLTAPFGIALLLAALTAGAATAQGRKPPLPPSDEPALEAAREALPPGENLIAPPPQGWLLAYSDRDDDGSVYEYIPPDQSPENAREAMAITLRYDAKGATAAGVLEQLRRAYEQDCGSSHAEPAASRPVSGQPGLRQLLLCGQSRRGGGSAVLRQVVIGREAAYAVDYVWRGAAFKRGAVPADARALIADWQRALDAIRLCDTRDPARPCQ